MIVSEALILLRNSELKQLAIGKDTSAVIGFINRGILEIYKRFSLWEAEATITMAADTFIYSLDGVDANVSIDLSDHSLLMIEEAYDVNGDELVLNDETDVDSILTPQYHQIEVVAPVVGDPIYVIYRASPAFLTNEKQVIPLPPQFHEALFDYVAYKGHGSIKTDTKGENNTHYLRFIASINLINSEGLTAQDDLKSTKFVDRGFP